MAAWTRTEHRQHSWQADKKQRCTIEKKRISSATATCGAEGFALPASGLAVNFALGYEAALSGFKSAISKIEHSAPFCWAIVSETPHA